MAATSVIRLALFVAIGAQLGCTDAAPDRNPAAPGGASPGAGGATAGTSAAGSPGGAGAPPAGGAASIAGAAGLGGAGGGAALDVPHGLTVGDRAQPLNVEGTPLFGWLLPDAGNELQSAYQILVTRVADEMVVWDSDKVVSAQQSYVSYAGPALASQTSYAWQVRTWNRSDQVSPWSAPALFDTGLSDQDWDASWIRRASSDADDYTLARAELTVTASPVTRARAYLAASHQAELYLNGVLVDRGSAFAYPGEGYYQATDVTAHVKAGEVLALGAIYRWYGSGQGRPAGERGLLVRLVVDHADGTEQVLVTDGKWRVKRASAWQTGTPKRNGDASEYVERVDARAATPGWNLPGYDASSWAAADVVGTHPTAPFSHLQAREGRTTSSALAPESVKTLPDGAVVADFGKVITARPVVHFKSGQAGRVVNLLTSYRLLNDGHVSTTSDTTQGTDLSFRYTQAGGEETFRAFTHLGWRYLQISSPGETLANDAIQALVEHIDAPPERKATFKSSNETLNRVFELVQHSALQAGAYQFVDTPTREKGQFLHDAANVSFASMAGWFERDLTQQALREFAASQTRFWPDGRVNAVYPNGDGKRDIPDFTQMYVCWAARYFDVTGDLHLIEELYPKLVKIADYVWSYRSETTGLITNLAGGSGEYTGGIVDWPVEGRFGYDMTTAARTTVNVLGVEVLRSVGRLAAALGRPAAEAERHQERAELLAAAINSKLRRADGVYVDGLSASGTPSSHASQHASSYALAFGVVPNADRARIGEYLAGLGLKQGPMTAHWLLKALGEVDRADDVVARLTDENGWGHIVAEGGSFTWESWAGSAIGDSESHGWGAQALVDFIEILLGVRVTSPGGADVSIVLPRTKLTSAQGAVPLQRGTVAVAWQRSEAGKLTVQVDLPTNVRARLSLPLTSEAISAGGTGSPKLVGNEGERRVYELGSGRSELTEQ
jgi:alpha-L-rhamnosidase